MIEEPLFIEFRGVVAATSLLVSENSESKHGAGPDKTIDRLSHNRTARENREPFHWKAARNEERAGSVDDLHKGGRTWL